MQIRLQNYSRCLQSLMGMVLLHLPYLLWFSRCVLSWCKVHVWSLTVGKVLVCSTVDCEPLFVKPSLINSSFFSRPLTNLSICIWLRLCHWRTAIKVLRWGTCSWSPPLARQTMNWCISASVLSAFQSHQLSTFFTRFIHLQHFLVHSHRMGWLDTCKLYLNFALWCFFVVDIFDNSSWKGRSTQWFILPDDTFWCVKVRQRCSSFDKLWSFLRWLDRWFPIHFTSGCFFKSFDD